MQGAMFMAPEPWPIVSAVAERELSSFGPPSPDTTPEPDTFLARLGELPLLAQPGERWLYSAGSQVLGVLAGRAAGAPFEDVMRERVLAPLGMDDTAFTPATPAGSPPRTSGATGSSPSATRRTGSGHARRGSPTGPAGWCPQPRTCSGSAGCCCCPAVTRC
jgi:CubicO group peptidase (beta-lactamase class C family)